MKNNAELKMRLQQLGLSEDEALIFACLNDSPRTLLEVSRVTGIHRSSVYRIVDSLTEKSLVHELTTDSGRLIAAARPEALELLVIEQEEVADARRSELHKILPLFDAIKAQDNNFAIKTYSGKAGIKQMLWNELQSKTEVLIFSRDSLDLLTGKRWAERYRAEIIERGIKERSIENLAFREAPLSAHQAYDDHYHARFISPDILAIKPEVSIHDDMISVYNAWTDSTQLGTEITNPALALFMRQIFESYWEMAEERTQ